jgi:hypothetical protein
MASETNVQINDATPQSNFITPVEVIPENISLPLKKIRVGNPGMEV